MLLSSVLKIAVNAFAIYLASLFLDGVQLNIPSESQWQYYAIFALIGFVIWFGNTVIKPVLKVLTFPVILVTFGLSNVVLNMLILWGADLLLPQLEITGFVTLLLASLIVSFINGLLFFI